MGCSSSKETLKTTLEVLYDAYDFLTEEQKRKIDKIILGLIKGKNDLHDIQESKGRT